MLARFHVVAFSVSKFCGNIGICRCLLHMTASGSIHEYPTMAASHRLFAYGTLKRGQPNAEQLGAEYGVAKYIGQARTVKKWPLVIASQCNIPYLLDNEGIGNHIMGEIYEVDDKMLQHCDEFEGCPDHYQRTTVQVHLTEDAAGSKVDGEAEDVLVYVLRGFKDFMLELPHLESYDHNGPHGLVYKARY